MTSSSYRARRATLDDMTGLRALWSAMHFAADEFEKRLTEFQVVESADGRLVGALGIQILAHNGLIHSESFQDFAVADEVRPLLLDRIRSLAANHGVFRLWTRENSPFWTRQGFQAAEAEALKKLPAPWAAIGSGWLTLQLKDEGTLVSMEKELALFMEAEKQQTARTLQHVRAVKILSTVLALVLGFLVVVILVYVFRKNPAILTPKR